ncbi:MAG: ABC transporter ATP-binding protein [Actinobacteria bacterium]|nr:ABC transporter ATP-binding protein [Actinomycetota bacterium]
MPTDAPSSAPTPSPTANAAVVVKDLTKTYQSGPNAVEALRGIDLTIERGEFVAVMGPSGSGKSTLMHILGALENATGGTVWIGGERITGLDDKRLTLLRRDAIGFIFQFFNLLPTLTAEENVMLPSMIAGEGAGKLRDHARELLDLVGLSERREHLPSQLSGGEQQRVSVARSLMRNPDLLLADEPTGNLDSKNAAAVLDMLRDVQAKAGHTILMVTHDATVASRASRVIFLRDGRIAGEVPGGDASRILEFFGSLEQD